MAHWVCKQCYSKLPEGLSNFTAPNFCDEACFVCKRNRGIYYLTDKDYKLFENFVSLDAQGNPLWVKIWLDAFWAFYWDDDHWSALHKLDDLSVFDAWPERLTRQQIADLHRRHKEYEEKQETQPMMDTIHEPTIYGVWINDDWMVLGDGAIFHTLYMRVAKAELNRAYRWREEAGITGDKIAIAIIDSDGNPRFLKETDEAKIE